jgi:hypothetical protein
VLDGALPRGASFSDLDAYGEINGHFLFIEHKPEGYAWEPGNGQYRALRALAGLPRCTVWVVRPKAGGWDIRDLEHPGEVLWTADDELLREMVAGWGSEADQCGCAGRWMEAEQCTVNRASA